MPRCFLAPPDAAQLTTLATLAMPVRHIVMFGIKEGTTEAQISTLKTGLAGLKSKIPEIKSFELGFDLKLKGGQSARRSRPVGPPRHALTPSTGRLRSQLTQPGKTALAPGRRHSILKKPTRCTRLTRPTSK